MMTKEQQYKLLEGLIDTMQNLALECVEIISVALWNDAIETAAKITENSGYAEQIRRLKK